LADLSLANNAQEHSSKAAAIWILTYVLTTMFEVVFSAIG